MTLDPTDPTGNLRASIAYTQETYGISEEAAEFRRRRGPDKIIEPTEADWAEYREAIAATEKIERNPFIPVDEIAFDEPQPREEPGDYTETEDEWIARVAQLLVDSNGRVPRDLDRALSANEATTLLDAASRHPTHPTKENDR